MINTVAVTEPEQVCRRDSKTQAPARRPRDIALDAAGNLFFETMNVVARVDAQSHALSIAAGSGRRGFSGDGGPATKAKFAGPSGLAIDSAGNVFVADYRNRRVRRVDARTKVITTIAGNGLGMIRAEL